MPSATAFETDVNFCPACGTLLPSLPARGNVFCLACKHEIPIESFASVKYDIDNLTCMSCSLKRKMVIAF